MRFAAWAIAFALVLASLGAAAIILPEPIPDQLVEGHTVFATITSFVNASRQEEFAAAVAVLIRERPVIIKDFRFPGVLWFNDQYLVDPKQDVNTRKQNSRYPCTGAVIAVNRGDPVDIDANGRYTLINATYMNESYHVTDPNDYQWEIDLWKTTSDTYAWTVHVGAYVANATRNRLPDSEYWPPIDLLNDTRDRFDEARNYTEASDHKQGQPDNGKCKGSAYKDSQTNRLDVQTPGENGMKYPCPNCSTVEYNALLYMRLEHLRVHNKTKDHRERVGEDWYNDAAACSPSFTNSWNCPDNDDDREGNSHPFNPELAYPGHRYSGANNHGGSDNCLDGPRMDCHATFDIDIYFGYMTAPEERKYYVYEIEGSDAPYHCHEGTICGPRDYPYGDEWN